MTREKLIALAREQIGTRGIDNPYNRAYYGRTVTAEKYAWCAVFVWWLLDQLGAEVQYNGGEKTASCTALMKWAKEAGRFTTRKPDEPAIVLYNWDGKKTPAHHCGLWIDGTAIEGNTATDDDPTGRVMERTRGDSVVIGYIRLDFDEPEKDVDIAGFLSAAEADKLLTYPVLGIGQRSRPHLTVWVQRQLGIADDGVYGRNTKAAVEAYQKENGLAVDGLVGKITLSHLLGVL